MKNVVRWGVIFPATIATLVAACGDEERETKGDAGSEGVDAEVEGKDEGGVETAKSVPTWYQDIQPVLHEKCSACHQPGQIAPFSLLDYESAKPFAALMVEAVEEGRMPPFYARETPECTPRNEFADDPRLSKKQLKMLREWSEAGAPEGDPKKPAKLTEPPPVEIERADVVMKLPEPIVVEYTPGGPDLHTCQIVDPGIAEDGYIVSRQVTSGNPRVLHHVTTYIVSQALEDGTPVTLEEMNAAFLEAKGVEIGDRYDCFGGPTLDGTGLSYSLLGSWAPGAGPVVSPPDSGQPVTAGSVVVLDMHYHPIPGDDEVDDSTEYALQFADEVPRYVASPIFMGYADAQQPLHEETDNGVATLLTFQTS